MPNDKHNPVSPVNMASKETLKMEYTRLGNSGLKISKVILGAMSYGSSQWYALLIPILAFIEPLSISDFFPGKSGF